MASAGPGPRESEYEVHEDDDDDLSVDLSRVSEKMRDHVNVESDYEDVRQYRQRRSRGGMGGRGKSGGITDDEELLPDVDDLSAPSTPMSSTDKDNYSFMAGKCGDDDLFDSEYSDKNDSRTEAEMGLDDEDDDAEDDAAYGAYKGR